MNCKQLVDASRGGRADNVIALLAEGANIEYKHCVRSFSCIHHVFVYINFFHLDLDIVFRILVCLLMVSCLCFPCLLNVFVRNSSDDDC
jgi:hypothetical protein